MATRLPAAASALFPGLDPDPERNLRLIVRHTAKWLRCECAALGFSEEQAEKIRFRAAFRLDPPPSPARETAREICRALLLKGKPCAASGACPPNPRFRSFLAHPVLLDGRACGALLALASRERRFEEEELSLMGFLSSLAASEEGRRRAEAAAQRLAALEAAIAAVDSARREATSREDYLERCLRALPGALGADGAFFLAEHAGARAPLEIRFFPPQPGERPTPVTMNSTLEETLRRSPENRRLAPGEPVILEAKATLPRPLFARRGVKAWVLSPLGRNGRVSGLLGLELRGRKARFEPCWARVAAAAAGLLGLGLEEIAFREGIASLRQTVREVVEILDSEHAKDPAAEASPPAGEPMLLEIERSLRRLAESVRGKRRFAYRDLTPTEIRVANLIREGRSSKEVAERLGLSPRTVHTHRYNIRKKLNLCGGSKTLRTHLCAME